MFRIEESITIDAPREYVWEVLQDFTRRREWDARVVTARQLDPGPVTKGTRSEVVTLMYGIEFPATLEFVNWDPPVRSGVRTVEVVRGMESVVGSWKLDSNDDGSTTWTTTIVLKASPGLLGTIMQRFLMKNFEQLTRRSQQNLKALVEKEYPAADRPAVVTARASMAA